MEYVPDEAVVDLLEQEHGFKLINAMTGQACSEFLFARTGTPAQRTMVTGWSPPRSVKPKPSKSSPIRREPK